MITKTVKRYYCDHCGKGGQSSYCIRQHETTCIRNPNRACIICSEQHRSGMLLATHATVTELMEALKSGGIKALEEKAEGCPACMLAAIVQRFPRSHKLNPEEDWLDFDYKKQLEEWRSERMDARMNSERECIYPNPL